MDKGKKTQVICLSCTVGPLQNKTNKRISYRLPDGGKAGWLNPSGVSCFLLNCSLMLSEGVVRIKQICGLNSSPLHYGRLLDCLRSASLNMTHVQKQLTTSKIWEERRYYIRPDQDDLRCRVVLLKKKKDWDVWLTSNCFQRSCVRQLLNCSVMLKRRREVEGQRKDIVRHWNAGREQWIFPRKRNRRETLWSGWMMLLFVMCGNHRAWTQWRHELVETTSQASVFQPCIIFHSLYWLNYSNCYFLCN